MAQFLAEKIQNLMNDEPPLPRPFDNDGVASLVRRIEDRLAIEGIENRDINGQLGSLSTFVRNELIRRQNSDN